MIWPVCDFMDHAVYYNRPVKENYDYVSERILTPTMVTNSWNTLFNFTPFCIYTVSQKLFFVSTSSNFHEF